MESVKNAISGFFKTAVSWFGSVFDGQNLMFIAAIAAAVLLLLIVVMVISVKCRKSNGKTKQTKKSKEFCVEEEIMYTDSKEVIV